MQLYENTVCWDEAGKKKVLKFGNDAVLFGTPP